MVAGLFLLFSDSLGALDPQKAITQYTHQAWHAEEGLPQNSVQAIVQTRDGYLWLGTQEGLVRFDGVRFAVFDEKSTPSLPSSNILALCAGTDGSLWIGTRGGGLLQLVNGSLRRYGKAEGVPNDFVRSVYEDAHGRIWAGTEGGVVRQEEARFVPAFPAADAVPPRVVLAIAQSGADIWLGTDGGGLLRLRGRALETFTQKSGLPSNVVRCLYPDADGTLWIGTRGGGLARFRRGAFTNFPSGGGAWTTIGAIRRDRDGNLWVGTRGGGLLRLRGEEITSFTKTDGLASDMVMCAYEDREGTLWIGTDGEGLHRFKDGKVTTFSVQEGLSDNMLVPILEDPRGTLWLGSYGGGLNAFRDGRFTAYTTKQGLSSNLVASLAADSAGTLWVGTDGGGLNRLRDGRFTHYGAAEGLSNNRVISLLVDRESNLWVGTYGGGLNLLQGGVFLVYGTRDGLTSAMVNALTQDRAGTLWIGTDGGGLNRFRDGRFSALTTRDGLAHDTVYRIYEDAEGVLWIGTYGGLSRWKNGKFTSYTTKDGLFNNKIFQILEDEDGNLWMSCNKGIFRVRKKELNDFADGKIRAISAEAFGTADGMKSSECNGTAQPAGWKSRDGTLWFPTTLGAVRIDPRHLPINNLQPPVSIEGATVDKRNFSATGSVRAAPGPGQLEIHYAGLSLLDPEKVHFRYRLEGFESAWVEPGTRRTAFYTNTPPGHYRFRVIACNNDGVWNETGAALEIFLEPHFYQTYWFYGLSALGVILGAVGSHSYRVRYLTRRKHELTHLVAERTKQLEEANAILRQLSSQDGLTGIANRRHFDEELSREWRRAIRSHEPLSLLMLDIDSFKSYNDLYGHQQGDDCLRRVASALGELLKRPRDLPARYGGEEFAVILPATDPRGAARVAETLRAGIEAMKIPHAKAAGTGIVTTSIGVSGTFSCETDEPSSLISRADEALYRAKQAGRNRVCVSDPERLAV